MMNWQVLFFKDLFKISDQIPSEYNIDQSNKRGSEKKFG